MTTREFAWVFALFVTLGSITVYHEVKVKYNRFLANVLAVFILCVDIVSLNDLVKAHTGVDVISWAWSELMTSIQRPIPVPTPMPAPEYTPPEPAPTPTPTSPTVSNLTPDAVRRQVHKWALEGIDFTNQGKCGSARADIKKMGDLVTAKDIDVAIGKKHTRLEQAIQNDMVQILTDETHCDAVNSPRRMLACETKAESSGLSETNDLAAFQAFVHKCDLDILKTTQDW
jgi:hypothetical protein